MSQESTSDTSAAPLAPADVISALANPMRWEILRELIRSEPLPVIELARRLKAPATGISKHALTLQRAGLLERHYGLYRIPARFLIPEHPFTLDYGIVILRLDQLG